MSADFIAQANQLGSGDQDQAIQPTTDQLSPFESRDQGQMPAFSKSRKRTPASNPFGQHWRQANPLNR